MIDDINDFEEIYPNEIPKLKSIILSINENYNVEILPKPSDKKERFLLAKVDEKGE